MRGWNLSVLKAKTSEWEDFPILTDFIFSWNFSFLQKQKFTSLKLELMKRFIGSHDETIECKIAVSEKQRGGERADERRWSDKTIRGKKCCLRFNPFRNYQFPRNWYLPLAHLSQQESSRRFVFYRFRGKWMEAGSGENVEEKKAKLKISPKMFVRHQRIIFIAFQITGENFSWITNLTCFCIDSKGSDRNFFGEKKNSSPQVLYKSAENIVFVLKPTNFHMQTLNYRHRKFTQPEKTWKKLAPHSVLFICSKYYF